MAIPDLLFISDMDFYFYKAIIYGRSKSTIDNLLFEYSQLLVFGGRVAVLATDIKQIIAYSTTSQLG